MITPETLEAEANRIIGEAPITLEQEAGRVVSWDSAARLLDRKAYQNFRDTGETGLEHIDADVDIVDAVNSRSMIWNLADLVRGRLSPKEWNAVSLKLGIGGGKERSFAQVGQELDMPKSTAFDAFYQGMTKLTSNR